MELEWVIYHLIHNDDENFTSIIDLDIDLCRSDDDQWNRLILGLSRNRTIQSIELLRGYQNPIITEDDLKRKIKPASGKKTESRDTGETVVKEERKITDKEPIQQKNYSSSALPTLSGEDLHICFEVFFFLVF